MSNVAQAPTGPGEAYRVLRELGARSRRTFAAIREPHELVVLQRFVRTSAASSSLPPAHGAPRDPAEGAALPATSRDASAPATSGTMTAALPPESATTATAEEIALLLRDARCVAKHWHPNVARVKHVAVVGPDLLVASELVDGVTLEDLLTAGEARGKAERERLLCMPVLLRVLVDVLGGLHGLHGLRDGMNAQLNAFHGELSPRNVVVGRDGVARLVAVLRPRPVHLTPRSEAGGYAAPELRDAHTTQDARADLYAVGVMLWEALTGRRLFASEGLAEIAAKQRSEELERPALPATSPFAPLADVAMRALAFDPALRFRSASEMASELRRIAGTRLSPGSVVAQTVAELAGERIRARRAELDPIASGTRRRASDGVPAATPDAEERELAPRPGDVTFNGSTPADSPPVEHDVTGVLRGPPRATAGGRPADPPRPPPPDKGRYLVVPPRPAREAVDSEVFDMGSGAAAARAAATGERSLAGIRSDSTPALADDDIDVLVDPDGDDERTHAVGANPHAPAAMAPAAQSAEGPIAAKAPATVKAPPAAMAPAVRPPAPAAKAPAAKAPAAARPAHPQRGAASASLALKTSPVEIPVVPPRASKAPPPGATPTPAPTSDASLPPPSKSDAPPVLTALLRPPVLATPFPTPSLDDDDDDDGPSGPALAAGPTGSDAGVLPWTPRDVPPGSGPEVDDGGARALAAPDAPAVPDGARRKRALYIVAAAMVLCALLSLIAFASQDAPRRDAKRGAPAAPSAPKATAAEAPAAPRVDPPPPASETSAEGTSGSVEARAAGAGAGPPVTRETISAAPKAEPAPARAAEPPPVAEPAPAPSPAPKPAARPKKNSYEPLGI